MHTSVYNESKRLLDAYLPSDRSLRVLELGSRVVANQNLNHRTLFDETRCSYPGLDIVDGENVDVVMDEPYRIPVDSESVDVAVCGQVFEHVPFFWVSFLELARVTHHYWGDTVALYQKSLRYDESRIRPHREQLVSWGNYCAVTPLERRSSVARSDSTRAIVEPGRPEGTRGRRRRPSTASMSNALKRRLPFPVRQRLSTCKQWMRSLRRG